MESTKHDELALFLTLPLEIRLRIYSCALRPRNIHIQPRHYFSLGTESIEIGPLTNEPHQEYSEYEAEWWDVGLNHIVPYDNDEMVELCREPKTGRQISPAAARKSLFVLHDCFSTRAFDEASAVPPGTLDYIDCHRDKELNAHHHNFRRTCKQIYLETEALASSESCRTSLQFARVRDLFLYTILLTSSERNSIIDIRLNVGSTTSCQWEPGRSATWLYFCNVITHPWDRRSLHVAADGDESHTTQDFDWLRKGNPYYDHFGKIHFNQDSSPRFLRGNEDDARGLANDGVKTVIEYHWNPKPWIGRQDIPLGKMKTKQPMHLKLALQLPNITISDTDDELVGDREYDADEAIDEFLGISKDRLEGWLPDLVRLRRQIKNTEDEAERHMLQQKYDDLFHGRFCDPLTAIDLRTDAKTGSELEVGLEGADSWASDDWVGHLMQAQSFESFEIECFGDDKTGNTVFRRSDTIDVMTEGLSYRFTRMGIGPHPYIMYS